MTSRAALVLLAVTACGGRDEGRRVADAPPAVTGAELALQLSDSIAIWFTSARADTSDTGRTCRERVLEIRAGTRTTPVPLLYTAEVPTVTTDSTVEVHLWRHCVPADLYRVNLRTGQPTKVGS